MFATIIILVPLSFIIRQIFSYPILYFLVGMEFAWIHLIGGAIGALFISEIDDLLIKIFKLKEKV
jgi:hypothetical protein